MKKMFFYSAFSMLTVALSATVALAAQEVPTVDYARVIVIVVCIITAGLTMACGTVFTSLAMGHSLHGATAAVGRNPEVQGKLMPIMLVGLAMIEALAIYALVIALVLIYANPLLQYI